ncbi:MAG: hypothetical protein QOJ43_591 [Gaiellaceae bacterium]|jgi:hypothetical protein|nr:hypothetical protein [Gaiellaceae bacterium]
MTSVAVKTEEREVALGEVRAVLDAARDEGYRTRLTALVASVENGELAEDEASELERVLELGLQAGRIRAVYGAGGEQAALRLFRRLPAGAELAETARSVSAALATLNGRSLESFRIEAIGPGMYRIAVVAGGAEVAVRLDRSGVQLASIGV